MDEMRIMDEAEMLALAGRREEALARLKLVKRKSMRERRLMLEGTCLIASDPARAAEAFSKIPEGSPFKQAADLNRGIAESLADKPEARQTLETTIGTMPEEATRAKAGRMTYRAGRALAHLALATLLQKKNEDAEAIPHLEECLKMEGELAAAGANPHRARLDLAYCRMREGIFDERSWELHESRWCSVPKAMDPPRGEGNPDGRTVMVYAEQGMGDNIQFARYLRPLRERAAKVILVTHKNLKGVLSHLADETAADGENHQPYDLHMPIMSLPHALGVGSDISRWNEPYIAPERKLAEEWKKRLPKGRKAGVVWSGGRRTSGEKEVREKMERRNCPRSLLLDSIPEGFEKISLQMPPENAPGTHDPMGAARDYADTAAIISHLDFVAGVDTSVIHLAAAMGKPTMMLSRKDACWRWGKSGSDTPWYPSMKIFRQEREDDWETPAKELKRHLAKI